MKITQIMLGKGFGGAERSFVDTALGLAARGHQVQAICHRKFIKRSLLEHVPGLQLEAITTGGEYDFTAPRRIARLLRNFQPRIVHTQLKRAAWHGGRAAYMAGVPAVAKLHNYVGLKRYRYVHTLIGTTRDQREHILRCGWPEDRVTVIPNFSRVSPAAAARPPECRPVRFLTCGRLVHKKGFDLLLLAFKELLACRPEASLTIGGSGQEAGELQRLAAELDLMDKVRFAGWIEDVSEALDAADVFVLPSREEPFGIVMLEAMARGVPIVATKTKGPEDVLSKGSAYFVEIESVSALAAGLKEVVENPQSAGQKAAAALEIYRATYSADAVLPRLEALYMSVGSL